MLSNLKNYFLILLDFSGAKRKFNYCSYWIQINNSHCLLELKKKYVIYDESLPFPASKIEYGACIVAFGANIGDSLLAIVSRNSHPHYICIEEDPYFFKSLNKQAEVLKEQLPNLSIQFTQSSIGKLQYYSGLKGHKGTKSALEVRKIRSVSSDQLLERSNHKKRVKLIKRDVNGFDFDVINSTENIINKNKLMILFEALCGDLKSVGDYVHMLGVPQSKGYKLIWLFGYFGKFFCCTSDLDQVSEMLSYTTYIDAKHKSGIIYFDLFMPSKSFEYERHSIISEY